MRRAVAIYSLFFFVASGFSQSRRFSADDLTKIVRISDPQISPDGKTISTVVGRANLKEDRWDSEIDFVDVATKQLRVMTRDRMERRPFGGLRRETGLLTWRRTATKKPSST